MGQVFHPDSGAALDPPPVRRASLQFRRPAAMGSAVRHLSRCRHICRALRVSRETMNASLAACCCSGRIQRLACAALPRPRHIRWLTLHSRVHASTEFAMPKPACKKKVNVGPLSRCRRPRPAVATLIGHGLDTVYALPGVHNDHLFDAFQRAGEFLRVVHTRHEQGAALYGARARRWRPANRRPIRWCPARACSIRAPRCSPPTG